MIQSQETLFYSFMELLRIRIHERICPIILLFLMILRCIRKQGLNL